MKSVHRGTKKRNVEENKVVCHNQAKKRKEEEKKKKKGKQIMIADQGHG